jgi:tRNA CCA-adding enzyme
MAKKINDVLNEVLGKVKLPKEKLDEFETALNDFIKKLKKRIDLLNIDAEIFVGGSFAKKTVIKKEKYDADVFLRFNKKYNKEISILTKRLLQGVENVTVVHGSRDYFQIKLSEDFFIELIPVIKVKKPEESENITDLSYSHVKYLNKKVKSQKMRDEILLAKAFCYANHCYGAESYIKGFSGYALELLVYHYKSFSKFLKESIKIKEKTVIDIEKYFKKKNQALMDLNESKLSSPIVLIDPTFKHRNALAALSNETFEKFQKDAKAFLKSPSEKSFELQKKDLDAVKKKAEKLKQEFILLESKTQKQEGDVAGSKLLKFYRHLDKEVSEFFNIKDKGFNYNQKQSARFFFVTKPKKEILIVGPNINDEKNVKAFEKAHKNYFTKKGKIYAKELIDFSLKEFIEKWKKKNSQKITEMYVERLKIL